MVLDRFVRGGTGGANDGRRQVDQRVPPIVETMTRDWHSIASAWIRQVREEEWWRDPELDLAGLSRRLGTNTAYLSRGLNDGLGFGFAEAINGLRVEHAAAQLRSARTGGVMAIALDAGFGSRATFHRVFKERFGMTPSAYRYATDDERNAV